MLSLSLASCAKAQVQADFYRGLLSIEARDRGAAAEHFEKALNSSNGFLRQAAAEELANLMYGGFELSAKTYEKVKKEASGAWAAAFAATEKGADRQKALEFLLNFEPLSSSFNEARLFTLRECEKKSLLTEIDLAAVDGHYASSRSRYNEALVFFRKFLEEGEWPEKLPELFVQYPSLINELGKTLQYTSSGGEGLELFLRWEENFNGLFAETAKTKDLRFRLIFYAARIARRMGRQDQAVSLFQRARPLSAESEQADACIWYILDSSLSGIGSGSGASASSANIEVFLRRLEEFIPYRQSDVYFNDVLEKILQVLVSNKDGKRLLRTFSIIREKGSASSRAAYAWLIARFIEEGFFSAEEKQLAATAVSGTDAAVANAADPAAFAAADATVFKRIAYNAKDTTFYYHSLAAASLGEPFLDLQTAAATKGKSASAGKSAQAGKPAPTGKTSPQLQFLLGFFSHGAGELSNKYIRSLEKELSPEELRAVAQALNGAGQIAQSMRLVSLYVNKNGYVPGRADLELMYPRPFKELVEKYAAQIANQNEAAVISPALLYGLIRTESAFQSSIVSRAGAVGLCQLIPSTAAEMAERIRRAGGPDYAASENGINLSDPEINIHIGSYYLGFLMGRFEDTLLSLLAYNGGMNRVRRWRAANTMPVDLFLETITIHETRDYGRKVMAAAAVYEELYRGR